VDAITGTHRSTINIGKAAKLSVKQGPVRFAKVSRRSPRIEQAPPHSTIANGVDRRRRVAP
jgi:hypothetical protein